jgi:tetratricopeptide (TPR) repeat protein
MLKWIVYLILAVVLALTWQSYSKKVHEMDGIKHKISELQETGDSDSDDLARKMQSKVDAKEGEQTFTGILIVFLGAGLLGVFFVLTVLPFFAHRLTHAIYDSAEMVEQDSMHAARSLVAQGDYHGAIAAFQQAATTDPLNRLPWVEIAKIQKDNLEDPRAAIQTIRHALESQEWEINDAAYFLFRLAELYNEVEGDRVSAVAIMNQVIEQFPETRHSANASHKLHEWSMEDNTSSIEAEEAEFIARQNSNNVF